MSRTYPAFTVRREPPVWAPLTAAVRHEFSEKRSRELLVTLQPLPGEPSTLRVGMTPSDLARGLRDGTLLRLEALLRSVSGNGCTLAIVPLVDGTPTSDPAASLEHFIAGPTNQTALEAAHALISSEGPVDSPLFVWGSSAVGKTHLVRGIATALDQKPPCRPALYLTAENLALDLASAILGNHLAEIREKLSAAGALLVDDLQTLAQRDATRRELEAVIERQIRSRRPVVLSADRPAEDLEILGPVLHEIVSAAIPVPLSPPEWETRVAILIDRAATWGVPLPADAASTLSTGLGEEMHRMESVLSRMILLRRSPGAPVDVEHARLALSPGAASARSPSPDFILEAVARQFGLRLRDLRAPERGGPRDRARHLAAYLLKIRCGLSFPQIGRRLGRHHSTMVYAVRQIERRLAHDASLGHLLDRVEKEVAARMDKGT